MGTAETREREPSLDQVLDLAPQVISVAARHPDDQFDLVIEVNLRSTFVLAREIGRSMVERRGGRIVNAAAASPSAFPRDRCWRRRRASPVRSTSPSTS